MPKIKTSKSAAKRFTFTATGKVKHKSSNVRHILTKKTTKRKRQLRKTTVLSPSEMKRIKRLIHQ
jgi:large subunit ribosomal protein L35